MKDNFYSSYASVLFDIALKSDINKYYDNVREAVRYLDEDTGNVFTYICDLNISKEERKRVFQEIFGEVIDEKAIYFVWSIIDFNRARSLPKILKLFLKKCTEHNNIEYVKAITAFSLTEQQLEKLKSKIEKRINKEIVLVNFVDKELIGGIRLETDTWSLDDSFKKKLELMKESTINLERQGE